MKKYKFDFSGWATKNDILCSDGRTIRQNAFIEDDGKIVPLVWNHNHKDPESILGHALLENRPEGVYFYATLNNTPKGKIARELVNSGDIKSVSIYANQLKQNSGNVTHGVIRELSLVLAAANKGAVIEYPIIKHSDGDLEERYDEAIIHGVDIDEEEVLDMRTGYYEVDETEELNHAEEETKEAKDEKVSGDKTVQEIYETLNDEQKALFAFMVGKAAEIGSEKNDAKHSDEEGDNMKHNVFDNETQREDTLTHADQMAIVELAKANNVGSFQNAFKTYLNDNFIMHDGDDAEPTVTVGGFEEQYMNSIYPEYKNLGPAAPELITNDMGWVDVVLSKTHKSPISRIRTRYSDIRDIEALRAKGYKKGEMKKLTGQIKLAYRTTDPQTVYVKNALHRDDIVDITDFDYVQYLYNIDKAQLNEELAKAVMLGDLREDTDPDKIFPEHIRPIWTDADPYVIHHDIDLEAMRTELNGSQTGEHFGENYIYAEAFVQELLYAREKFKGSGQPDMFMDPHVLNVMLLARDLNGRRIYNNVSELESALNVKKIYTAEQFAGKVRTDGENAQHKLLAIVGNLADYQIGSTKGGEVTHFTQFDIDFNQQKSLLETRCSGAITKLYSFIVLEEPVTGD